MALVVEDGTGVVGAEAYASVAVTDTYWANRTHSAFSATWTGSTTALKEGALREASAYIDSRWGGFYKGVRQGNLQGLQWPRVDALDRSGYPLADLPQELVNACSDLAVRALSAALSGDAARGGAVKRNKVDGAVEQEFFEGASTETKYAQIENMLGPLLNDSHRGGGWAWK